MRLSLVILVYNEIVGLREIFDKIPTDKVDEVVVVDGGSTDGSLEFLKERGVRVLGQKKRGRGEAFRVAFETTFGDALVFFSPDGNEDPNDIAKFRPLLEAGNEMVIGNRMTNGGHNEEDELTLPLRKWANRTFTWMANRTWNRGHYVDDTINGFRAITRQAWERLSPDGEGYVIEYQCSIRAFKQGLKVAEFPTYEAPRLDEREGSPSLKTGLAFLRVYLQEVLRKAPDMKNTASALVAPSGKSGADTGKRRRVG